MNEKSKIHVKRNRSLLKLIKKLKYSLIVLFACCMGIGLSAQYIPTYSYEFNSKLRTNLDKIILEGVEDTCGVIDFFYPIELSAEGYRGSNVLQFQAENDCSEFIYLTQKYKGYFLELVVTDKYEIMMNLNIIEEDNLTQASERFYTDYIVNQENITSLPTISLRIDRDCKNKEHIDKLLDKVHDGYIAAAEKSDQLRNIPLRFHLGKSSRAEPPRFEIFGN